jgi:hypothetical protein
MMEMKTLLIAELKRPATRRAESREHFEEALEAQMHLTHAGLLKQVEHAFLMQPKAERFYITGVLQSGTRAAHVGEFTLHREDSVERRKMSDALHDSPEIRRTREYLPREGKRRGRGVVSCPVSISTLRFRQNSVQAATKILQGS